MSTVMIWQTRTTGSAETEELGRQLGKLLRPPAVIDLVSDLGGGKTTFVKGLAAGLGSPDRVVSPTFTLSRVYKAKNSQVHHFDFYRLSEPGILTDQLQESLSDPKVIVVVEWSDIVNDVLPKDRVTINLKPVAQNPDGRDVEFSYPSKLERIVERLRASITEVKE